MYTKALSGSARILGKALLALVLLATRPAPAASDPRLLWRQDLNG